MPKDNPQRKGHRLNQRKSGKNNLKQIREAQALSLQDLADRAVMSKTQVWELQRPNSNPTLLTAYALAAVLNRPVEELWPNPYKVKEETIVVRTLV